MFLLYSGGWSFRKLLESLLSLKRLKYFLVALVSTGTATM